MQELIFETYIDNFNGWRILRLPTDISASLPSRGMVMASVYIQDTQFKTALEPDGSGGHWFSVSDALWAAAGLREGAPVVVHLSPMADGLEPPLPEDLKGSLAASGLMSVWDQLTNKARWAWIRWIRATESSATRQKRIRTACDMLSHGKRRPCCFDHSRCTVNEVCKGGVLRAPEDNG